ncbi:GNAT family N-acetyltransferase [Phenylobacterium sp. LjRoot225]|uniref:GNAT family N-acetyltransferase n=1 Tax=Phenylobacterium sp. LjRoot225 TaxID=3342285 RepID=UPI003ED13227
MIPDARHPPILETERLRLQPLAGSDAPLLFPLMNDPDVMAYWDVPAIDDPDLVTAIVEARVAATVAGQAIHWAIRSLADDAFVGCCSLSEIDRWHKRGEIGFFLHREAWGQGYALEAMRGVVAYAAAAGIRRLSARTHLGNRRSEILLETLGFKEEGLLRGHILRDGERRDCHLFGLLL